MKNNWLKQSNIKQLAEKSVNVSGAIYLLYAAASVPPLPPSLPPSLSKLISSQ